MSYEGRELYLCSVGHLSVFDAMAARHSVFEESKSLVCQVRNCTLPLAWYAGIDDTNGHGPGGCCDEGEECRCEPDLEVFQKAVIQKCSLGYEHVLEEERYLLPPTQHNSYALWHRTT